MKTIEYIIAILMLGLTTNLSAQSDTEWKNNDAIKLEKSLKKKGWKEISGQPPMLQQIYNAYKLKNEIDANLQPKYVFGDAKGVGQFLNAAKLLATEKAKNDMVDHISKDMSRLLAEKASSKQIKKAQIQSVLNMVEKSKPLVTKKLNTITPVFLFYRELSNGNIEVMMSIAYDRGEITKLFKTVINEQSGLKPKK